MINPVLPSSCVTPAGTSIEVQNEWEENTHTHTHTHYCPLFHPLLSEISSSSCKDLARGSAGSKTPGVVTICGWSAAGRRPTPGLQQQLQGSCARVHRIQTLGVVTICGWSAAGRRPTPGLQQQLQGSVTRVRRIQNAKRRAI